MSCVFDACNFSLDCSIILIVHVNMLVSIVHD